MRPSSERAPYDPTALNLNRLRAYARKVAQETKVPKAGAITAKRASTERETGEEFELFGQHWVLLQVTDNGETNGYPEKVGEWHMRNTWLLAPDGGLYLAHYEEDFSQFGAMRGSWRFDSFVREMTANDVLELDHDHPHRSGENRAKKEEWWGDYPAGRLRAHAAGVGASLALRKLLVGG